MESNLSDIDLIGKVKKENDSEALMTLISRHSGIYHNVVNKYTYVPEVERSDLIDHKAFSIYQYALAFDPAKNVKFSSYIGQRIKYECQSLIQKKIMVEEVSELLPDTSEKYQDTDLISFIIDNAQDLDDRRFLKIFKLRHFGEKKKSWRAIAKAVGMTNEGVRKIYLRNIEFIKNRLKKEYLSV